MAAIVPDAEHRTKSIEHRDEENQKAEVKSQKRTSNKRMNDEAIGFGLPERHQKNLCNLWLKIKSFVEFVAKTYPSCSLCSSWIKPLTQRRREKNGYWLLAIGYWLWAAGELVKFVAKKGTRLLAIGRFFGQFVEFVAKKPSRSSRPSRFQAFDF